MVFNTEKTVEDGCVRYFIRMSLENPEDFLPMCFPKNQACNCGKTFIKKINSVYPDENGNIKILPHPDTGGSISIYEEPASGKIFVSFPSTTKALCPPQNLPLATGELPSEQR